MLHGALASHATLGSCGDRGVESILEPVVRQQRGEGGGVAFGA